MTSLGSQVNNFRGHYSLVPFHLMLENGFEDEVRKLHAQEALHLNLPSMRCVGYRQMTGLKGWEFILSAIY